MKTTHPLIRSRGLSMVEMLITISIIGILSAIGISVYKGVTGNAEVAIAGDFVESLNRGLHEYEQTNQTINVESNANSTDDELQIVKELQKTDVDAFGSPYFNPDWKPTASSNSKEFRVLWNGRVFVLLSPGEIGTGLRYAGDGTDF